MKDLTIVNEHTVILKFTLPILLGNLFQQLYNTIDSIIVGNFLGKNSLAVVSDCFNINFAIFLIIIGLTLGTNILTAKFYGAKNTAMVKQAIDTSYVFISITSILITLLGIMFSNYILIFFKVPHTLMNEANLFFKILMLGAISSFGYNTISSILRGLGDSKTPLYFLVMSTVINIFLDILFIVILKTKSYGAAFATIISQTISFMGIFIYFNKFYSEFKFNIKNINFSTYVFKLSLKIGLPAANLGDALSVFTAQNLGANKKSRVKKGFISTFIIGFIICLIISAIVIIFSKNLMRLFVKDTSVINI